MKLTNNDLEQINRAVEIVTETNISKCQDFLKSTGNQLTVYKCGTVLRIDIKAVFDNGTNT